MMDNNMWDDVDPNAQDAQRLSYPIVFWLNGDSKLKEFGDVRYTGGLFLTYDAIGKEIEIKDWKDSHFTGSGDNGEEIRGVASNSAHIAVIRMRRRWMKKNKDRTIFRPWNSQWEEGFRGQMQAIGIIRGLDNTAVTFTMKGNAQKYFAEVMTEHSRKLVSIVNRKAPHGKPGLPPYAVWMTVKAGPHEKVGSGQDKSEVTLPQIVLPAIVTDEYAMQRVVTREQLQQFQAIYKEAEQWAHEWDGGGMDEREMSKREQADSVQAPRTQSTSAGGSPDDPFDGAPFNDDEPPF